MWYGCLWRSSNFELMSIVQTMASIFSSSEIIARKYKNFPTLVSQICAVALVSWYADRIFLFPVLIFMCSSSKFPTSLCIIIFYGILRDTTYRLLDRSCNFYHVLVNYDSAALSVFDILFSLLKNCLVLIRWYPCVLYSGFNWDLDLYNQWRIVCI